jgi:transcriptional regulator with XRE-family HTH domain
VDTLKDWLTRPEGLATRLRTLRVQAGLSGEDLARAATPNGWAQSKVSRIENGNQIPSVDDILAWVRACGAGEDVVPELLQARDEAKVATVTFRARMRQGQAPVQGDYNALVESSTLIRHLETVYVPGLLQIRGYAERVLTEMITLHELEIDDVAAAVAARMERQRWLYSDKRFEFLLAEPVLRWVLPAPEVMRAQLDRLQTIIGLPNIRFGIIPMGVPLATTPQNSVQTYAGDNVLAVAETYIGETMHRGDEAAKYQRAIDLQWADAVEGDRARELITQAARALETGS